MFVNADRPRSDLGSAVRLFTATFTDAFSSLSALSHTGSNHRGIQCRTTYARTIAHTILYDTIQEFNVDQSAERGQLNLAQVTKKVKKKKNKQTPVPT